MHVQLYGEAGGFGTVAFDPSMCIRVQEKFYRRLTLWATNPVLEFVDNETMVSDEIQREAGERLLAGGKPTWMVANLV